MIELLGPEHSREGLTLHATRVIRGAAGDPLGVKLVGLGDAFREGGLKLLSQHPRNGFPIGQPQADAGAPARRDLKAVMRGRLGARLLRVDRSALAVHGARR